MKCSRTTLLSAWRIRRLCGGLQYDGKEHETDKRRDWRSSLIVFMLPHVVSIPPTLRIHPVPWPHVIYLHRVLFSVQALSDFKDAEMRCTHTHREFDSAKGICLITTTSWIEHQPLQHQSHAVHGQPLVRSKSMQPSAHVQQKCHQNPCMLLRRRYSHHWSAFVPRSFALIFAH